MIFFKPNYKYLLQQYLVSSSSQSNILMLQKDLRNVFNFEVIFQRLNRDSYLK